MGDHGVLARSCVWRSAAATPSTSPAWVTPTISARFVPRNAARLVAHGTCVGVRGCMCVCVFVLLLLLLFDYLRV